MDSDLLEMIEEEIQSYTDKTKIKKLLRARRTITEKTDKECMKEFLIGSVYGSCMFLYRTFMYGQTNSDIEEEFTKTISRRIKGLNSIFVEYLEE
ncbi:MAG: hypothetical protein ACOC6N_01455 [archaeon]|jgi:hypothetical protein